MQTQEVLVEEPGGGGSEDLEGLIDLVARANDVHVQALPVVRANPCAMHNRPLPGDRPHGLDLLYSTSCHGGKVNPASKAAAATTKLALWDNSSSSTNNSCSHHRPQAPPPPPPPEPREQGFATSRSDYTPRGFKDAGAADGAARDDYAYSKGVTRGGKAGGGWGRAASPPRGRQHQHQLQLQLQQKQKQQHPLHQQGGQHHQQGRDQQRPAPAKLPERLPTKDVVLTWLQHGSVPVGQSHFPDIIAPQPTDRFAARRRHNHSAVSE